MKRYLEDDRISQVRNGVSWSMPQQEFRTDVELIVKRVLNDLERKIFDLRLVREYDWQRCTRHLGIDRGLFHHTLYRVEAKLGRAFLESEPFALYPLYRYFEHGRRKISVSIPRDDKDTARSLVRILQAAA
jgi:hypothetical protein